MGSCRQQAFDGGLIELKPDGNCDIHWKSEVSSSRFEPVRVDHFKTPVEAANAWLKGMFPTDIDGVPLDWNA